MPKNWCFLTVVLEKSLESPLDCTEIQPVHPKGNQPWIPIRRTDVEAETPILWPPDEMNWLIWKNPVTGKDWRLGDSGWQRMRWLGSMDMGLSKLREFLMDSKAWHTWGHKELDMTEQLKYTELSYHSLFKKFRISSIAVSLWAT